MQQLILSGPGASQGSLTLWGYDVNKTNLRSINFSMSGNIDRRFIVNLNALYIGDLIKPSSIFEAINITIDSKIPYFSLPQNYCAFFEDYFGLQWDPDTNFYTMDPKTEPSFNISSRASTSTFTLANTNGNMVNFTFPYSAFSIMPKHLSTQDVTMSTFPLRKALNESQYIFRNTFLQEGQVTIIYNWYRKAGSEIGWPR